MRSFACKQPCETAGFFDGEVVTLVSSEDSRAGREERPLFTFEAAGPHIYEMMLRSNELLINSQTK